MDERPDWEVAAPLPSIIRALKDSGHANIPLERAKKWVQRGKLTPDADGHLTPAAVYHHYQTTTAGKRAA